MYNATPIEKIINYVFTLGWTVASSMSELGHVTNTNSPDCPDNAG